MMVSARKQQTDGMQDSANSEVLSLTCDNGSRSWLDLCHAAQSSVNLLRPLEGIPIWILRCCIISKHDVWGFTMVSHFLNPGIDANLSSKTHLFLRCSSHRATVAAWQVNWRQPWQVQLPQPCGPGFRRSQASSALCSALML